MSCAFLSLIMYRSIPKPPFPPPPGQTPGHLTVLKNFGPTPRYVASLDGQMPYPLELQRGQIPHLPHPLCLQEWQLCLL